MAAPSVCPARRKATPYSGPAAPPTSETMVAPVTVRIRPGVMCTAAPLRAFSAREHRGEAAGEVDAVIGVADRRVQLGQVVAVGLDDPGGRRYPGPEDFSVHLAPSLTTAPTGSGHRTWMAAEGVWP